MSVTKLRAVAVIAVVVAVVGIAPGAHAAERRDGVLVYSWFNREESDLEPAPLLDESAIRAIAPRGGEPLTLRGCTKAAGKADVGDCSISYRDPAISPNGRRVAFDAGATLALMRIDGSGFRLLPAHSDGDGDPAFSPDGTQLAFSAGASTAIFDLRPDRGVWISDLAGAGARRVTARGISPAWSPRGWIAFLRADGVYRVRPDGRGLRRLVARSRCTDVAWSPHGTQLVFACRSRLYVSRGDGRHVRLVPPRLISATAVAWAPSGGRLAVVPFDGGVVTIRPDGTHQRVVVDGAYSSMGAFGAGAVAWQPRRKSGLCRRSCTTRAADPRRAGEGA